MNSNKIKTTFGKSDVAKFAKMASDYKGNLSKKTDNLTLFKDSIQMMLDKGATLTSIRDTLENGVGLKVSLTTLSNFCVDMGLIQKRAYKTKPKAQKYFKSYQNDDDGSWMPNIPRKQL